MTKDRKIRGLLLLGIAIVAIVILSAGLSEVELIPGQLFYVEGESEAEAGDFEPLPAGHVLVTLLRAVIAIILLLLPVVLIYAILSPEFRKQVLRRLLPFLVVAVALYMLRPELLNGEEGGTFPGASIPVDSPLAMTPVQFVADPPAWLVLVASLSLALLLSAMLVGAVWFLRHRNRRPKESLEQLAQEAEEALELLRAGSDLKDVVMRCYAEMSHTLDRERGVSRQGSMTPREFEDRLIRVGLPGGPVRRLTRLFERVRYGAKVADEQEEEQALACLAAIVAACRAST